MLEQIFDKANLKDVWLIIIASVAIVGFWRGVWGIMDLYLIPKDHTSSLLASLVIGLIIFLGIAIYKKKRRKKIN